MPPFLNAWGRCLFCFIVNPAQHETHGSSYSSYSSTYLVNYFPCFFKKEIQSKFRKKKKNSVIKFINMHRLYKGASPCGVVANALDCNIIVSEFKLGLLHYDPFWTNTLGKCMKPLYLSVMSCTTTVLLWRRLWQ